VNVDTGIVELIGSKTCPNPLRKYLIRYCDVNGSQSELFQWYSGKTQDEFITQKDKALFRFRIDIARSCKKFVQSQNRAIDTTQTAMIS
jgi:hypothetical protein